MSANQLPDHLAAFVAAVQDNPALVEGAKSAVGGLTGGDAAQAAAAYYQAQGFTISAKELLDLIVAINSTATNELGDAELQEVSGGHWGPAQQSDFDMALLSASLEQVTITRPPR